MIDQLVEQAKKIIKDNIYITIATSSLDGEPWISPVYSAFDKNYTFYWVSPVNTKHSGFIKNNPRIALVIFDSKAPEGTGEGVYIRAKANEVIDEKEIKLATSLLYGKKNKRPRPVSHFTESSPRRIYKAVPEKIWMNAGEEINGYFSDYRVEVNLLKRGSH